MRHRALVGRSGQIATLDSNLNIETFNFIKTGETGIRFGGAVASDSTVTNAVRAPAAATDNICGVVVLPDSATFGANYPTIPELSQVNVMKFGRIHVIVNVAVKRGDLAYVDVANTTAGKRINFTNVSTGNILVGAFWVGAAADGTAVLELTRKLGG